MKKYKQYVESYLMISIYLVVSGYLIYQKNAGHLVYADAKLFLALTVIFFVIGFFSFFNIDRSIQIAGLVLMLMTLLTTSLYLFL